MNMAQGKNDHGWRKEDCLVGIYFRAKQDVLCAGYADEIDWQEDVSFDEVSETEFLREGAWVILSSGMREKIVRNKFKALSRIFFGWESAFRISRERESCVAQALLHFAHVGKIDAIVRMAERVSNEGFDLVRESIRSEGVKYLATFSFIGPITSYHLAKNLGLEIVKPDRHLVRISAAVGYNSPHEMCRVIADVAGEKLSVVDLVLWRFATLFSDYANIFRRGYEIGKDRAF